MFEKDEDAAMMSIVYDAEYVVAAEGIVNKYFDPLHNRNDIWSSLNSEVLTFLTTPKGKILFPATATAGDVQEYLSFVESIWAEQYMASFLETQNYHPYATYQQKIKSATDNKAKALIVLARGNEVRNKFKALEIIGQTFSFILDAAGGTLGATTSMNIIRGSKRSFKLPKAEVSCEVVQDVATITRGTAEEIAEAAEKIKNYRTGVGPASKGNYGYLEGKVGSKTLNGEMVKSGAPDENISEVFDAMKVNSQQVVGGEGAWLRNTDSEFKMLNRFANELGATKGQVYKNRTGTIKIVSKNLLSFMPRSYTAV